MAAAKNLAGKMKLKPGARAVVLNAPEGYVETLKPLPEGVELDSALDGDYDWVQIFACDRRQLEELAPAAIDALRPQSLLWVSYPKGSSKIQSDLTRDQGWERLQGADLKWVNLISVDDTWSAFCLRPFRPGEKKQSFR